MPGVTTVGQDSTNDVVLESEGVEPRHAVVSYEPQTGLLMMANFGGAATFVNGDKVPSRADGETCTITLKDGFRVAFGRQHIFRVEWDPSSSVKADYEFAMREMTLKGWPAFGGEGRTAPGEMNMSVEVGDIGAVLRAVRLEEERSTSAELSETGDSEVKGDGTTGLPTGESI